MKSIRKNKDGCKVHLLYFDFNFVFSPECFVIYYYFRVALPSTVVYLQK
jgi:hypothetical protein